MTALPTGDPLVGRFVRLDVLTEDDLPEFHPILADPEIYASGYVMHRRPASADDAVALARERFMAGQGQADGAGRGRTAYAIRLCADAGLGPAGTLVGTSSLAEAHLVNESIHLGSTLYGRRWWGTQVNPEAKLLLLAALLRGLRLTGASRSRRIPSTPGPRRRSPGSARTARGSSAGI